MLRCCRPCCFVERVFASLALALQHRVRSLHGRMQTRHARVSLHEHAAILFQQEVSFSLFWLSPLFRLPGSPHTASPLDHCPHSEIRVAVDLPCWSGDRRRFISSPLIESIGHPFPLLHCAQRHEIRRPRWDAAPRGRRVRRTRRRGWRRLADEPVRIHHIRCHSSEYAAS